MEAITSFFKFLFTISHYLFIYGVFASVAFIDKLLIRVASRPLGQLLFKGVSATLAMLSEAAVYSYKSNRTYYWIFFMPALMTVAWWRLSLSIPFFFITGRFLSGNDIKELMDSVQGTVESIILRGLKYRENPDAEDEEETEKIRGTVEIKTKTKGNDASHETQASTSNEDQHHEHYS